ncbi:efflux RND transporter permease subunit, partial [bacterium]|nr:efflux RND transporter permease subunit [bacterium]
MKGPVQWMAANHVASNILMMVFIVGGLIVGRSIQQEVFPEMELDTITVSVAYPGASPIDVEDGIIQPIERAVSGIDNIKRVTASASEGSGTVVLEIIEGSNTDVVLSDVKSEVDRILTFPEEAEEPVVAKVTNRRQVIELVVYGDVSERALFEETERIQDDLLAKPNITQVDIAAVRPQEISIEINEENLQRYNLTLNKVASIVRMASLDLPGGSVKTRGGEVLIRTNEKRYTGMEFDSIAVIVSPNGERVLLGDIATIKDGFAEWDMEARFDDKRAAIIQVYRVGDQTPKDISKTVNKYIEERNAQLPPSLRIAVWRDSSLILADRVNLLLRNGLWGYLLVMIILALFLEIRLAFFVAMGIGISFAGALLFMPAFNVSINMLSLFGFLLVLGVVVDDAIIVGENVFVHYRMGKPLIQASVEGTTEIMRAVVFAVLTSIAAFSPLLFVSGTMGKFLGVIPIIVISVLVISLIESLFILPSHLSGGLLHSRAPVWEHIENRRKKFDKVVFWFVNHAYKTALKWVAHNRYTTVAIGIAILLLTMGFVGGGYIKFVFRPHIDADHITVDLTMAPGTPFEETKAVAQ